MPTVSVRKASEQPRSTSRERTPLLNNGTTKKGITAITVEGTPVRFLGMPAVSPGTGHVSWLTKDRGAGGCGSWHLLKLKGSSATELEHRSRECDEDPSPPAPEAWPIVP